MVELCTAVRRIVCRLTRSEHSCNRRGMPPAIAYRLTTFGSTCKGASPVIKCGSHCRTCTAIISANEHGPTKYGRSSTPASLPWRDQIRRVGDDARQYGPSPVTPWAPISASIRFTTSSLRLRVGFISSSKSTSSPVNRVLPPCVSWKTTLHETVSPSAVVVAGICAMRKSAYRRNMLLPTPGVPTTISPRRDPCPVSMARFHHWSKRTG